MNGHDELLDLAYPYALDALDATEKRDVAKRLATAPLDVRSEFERRLAEVRETMAVMSSSTAVEPPPQLRDNIFKALDAPAVETSAVDTSAKVIPFRRRWQMMAAGVAAVFALLVGSIVVVNLSRPSTEITLAQEVQSAPDRKVNELTLPGGGILQVTFSRQLDAAVLHMESVAVAPEGKIYQLWLIDPDTNSTKSGGLMEDPNGDTTIAGLGSTKRLALTVEPDGGSTLPSTDPIAVADI